MAQQGKRIGSAVEGPMSGWVGFLELFAADMVASAKSKLSLVVLPPILQSDRARNKQDDITESSSTRAKVRDKCSRPNHLTGAPAWRNSRNQVLLEGGRNMVRYVIFLGATSWPILFSSAVFVSKKHGQVCPCNFFTATSECFPKMG